VGLYRYETPVHPKRGHPLDVNKMPVDKGKPAGRPGPGLEPSDGESRAGWTYLGRYKGHHAAITGIDFVPPQGSYDSQTGEHNSAMNEFAAGEGLGLVSVAEDRTMVEYDVDSSAVSTGLPLVGKPVPIEQTAVPTCCLFYPQQEAAHEQLVLTCNSEYKVKMWNRGAKVCRRTCLAPTFASPVNSIKLVPNSAPGENEEDALAAHADDGEKEPVNGSSATRYLAYSTAEKVVGLIQVPFDGNPHKSIGLVAHPGHVTGIDVSFDGKHMVTAGGQDLALNLWRIDTSYLARAVDRAGQGVEPFFDLIEGGADGEFVQQISDFFYYAQLRSQGEDR
jgi:WD40 repeat protein